MEVTDRANLGSEASFIFRAYVREIIRVFRPVRLFCASDVCFYIAVQAPLLNLLCHTG